MRNFLTITALVLVMVPLGARAATVNINTASVTMLDTLPGIGPAKAAAIVDYRTNHGPFARIEDIVNVKGIGPSTYATLKSLISVDGVDGGLVVESSKVPAAQPVAPVASSYGKQVVGTAATTKLSESTYAKNGVIAPEAASELAASGAVLPATSRGNDIFHSVWTLGFLGILVLAGGALLIL